MVEMNTVCELIRRFFKLIGLGKFVILYGLNVQHFALKTIIHSMARFFLPFPPLCSLCLLREIYCLCTYLNIITSTCLQKLNHRSTVRLFILISFEGYRKKEHTD